MPMFGTIGRFRPRAGSEAEVLALSEEWSRTIRRAVPGVVVGLDGRSASRPGEVVVVVLMRDEATYRGLAAMPEQDAWYRRLRELLEDDPVWDDVAWDRFGIDGFAG